jgi:hypothetical protein
VRPLLVHSHQPRVTRHIGGEDRSQSAGRGHGEISPACSGLWLAAIITMTRATRYARRGLDPGLADRACRC